MTRRLLGLVLLLALSLAAPAPAAFQIGGLSDQNPPSLRDPRLRPELSMTAARLVVRWDAALADPAPVDAWIATARAANLRPLVVFNRVPGTRCPNAPCVLPSVAEYSAAFRAFRQRWPSVTEFGPWNEANVLSQPPARNPQRAAEFYNAMVATCPACTVLGAELLDSTDAPSYVRSMRPFLAGAPVAWGVHNYEDVNHLRTTGTDALLRETTGEIWLTEAAGLVRYQDGSGRVTYPYDEQRAADATRFMFDYVDGHLDRVTRLYYYALQPRLPADDFFDTGLLRRDGSKRPAWDIVGARLGKLLPGVAAAPATTPPAPVGLLKRSLRLTRRGLVAGPVRCAKASKPRCRGRLEVRWNGRRVAFGKRSFSLKAGRSKTYLVRVGPGNRRKLRRKSSDRRVTLVIRLTKPRAYVRSYPKMKIVRRR
ncbi:MAG TPA: hypothetical protein VMY78_11335 [Solirubrobacteraceae bacterium]|nr:hypothetical protein [Solirubrobacteraceae bacterium]